MLFKCYFFNYINKAKMLFKINYIQLPMNIEETTKIHKVEIVKEASTADELKKYKELLDSGVITQEEFEEKKKQLLGL